jgi:NitT/TauT family transport system permease protein
MIWIVILLTWEGAYRVVGWNASQFPAPGHVIDATAAMLRISRASGGGGTGGARDVVQSPLVIANLVSARRLVVGFAVSILLGGLLGLAIWRWVELDRLLGPPFLGLQTLPSVCWVPLGILTFGLNERSILFVMVMGSCFAIAIALRDGLRGIPPLYQRAGLMLGASGWKFYRYVLIPASLPAFASSLRQGFSFAWRSLLGGEMILIAVDRHGIGFLLNQARGKQDVAQVIAVMIVMVVIGMLADRWIFAKLQAAIHRRFGLA